MKIKKGNVYRYLNSKVYIDVVHNDKTYTVRDYYTNKFVGIFSENQINRDFKSMKLED